MTLEDRIRKAYADWNERGLEGVADFWHPEVEYHEAPDFPGGGSYSGREAVRARFAEYVEVLGDVRAEVGRVLTRGDRAAWTVRYIGQSPEGLPHDHAWGYVGRFEDGSLVECHAHYDPDRAFEALEAAD